MQYYYRLYSQTQWYSKDEMYAFRLDKLQRLIHHVYQQVPYYRKLMDGLAMHPQDVNSLEILHNFPILTKEIILENYQDLTPSNLQSIKGVKQSYTGGTTGGALLKRNDAQTRSSVWGGYMRFVDWMGIKLKDQKLDLSGGYGKGKRSLKQIIKILINKLNHEIPVDTYGDYASNLQYISDLLSKHHIALIRSYPQFLYNIAQDLDSQGLRFSVGAIMTTAEPLLPQHRELFEKVFSAEVFDQYGCGEIGGIAYECPAHTGLHITEERVIVNTKDNGEFLLTDLDNYAMPYINYWNGDEAEFDNQECTCGRKSQKIKYIKGRVVDYIYGHNGEKLHSSYIWKILFESGIGQKIALQKFQVVQQKDTRLKFRYVGKQMSKTDELQLTQLITDKLPQIKVDYIQETDIENSKSGKYRPVISEIKGMQTPNE
ncbi:MAG: phenylacetate--CoA ligase family protein [Candidatus Cloacimonetes bacterium]|nr:phenylacetate--CoA ligase family protein [Candidatus Cloacimonadota bacterium]